MDRKQKYYALNTKLSYLSDKDINELKKENELSGYSKTYITTIDDIKIFVKKIPMTKLEYDNQFSTANLYNLPAFYNYSYSLGSAGINCNRELLTHIKTTNWVLNDKIENFPLMYHYRIMKNTNPVKKNVDLNEYIKKWNNDDNIKKYLLARDNAEYEIMICLEYFPHILGQWIKTNMDKMDSYIEQIMKITNIFHDNNIIHFDTHDWNIMTDGKIFYLTDFGLVMDLEFDLADDEKEFYKHNTYYQFASVIHNIFRPLFRMIYKEKDYFDKIYDLSDDMSEENRFNVINNNLAEICNHLKCSSSYLNLLKKYWNISKVFNVFGDNMRHNNKKDNEFPNDDIKELINKSQIGGNYYKYKKYKTKYLSLKHSSFVNLIGGKPNLLLV